MNIGIDLGGSHIGIGIVDIDAKIVDKIEEDLNKDDKTQEIIIKKIIYCINKLLERNKINIIQIEKIGIACPGEPKDGCMKNLVNLNIEKFPIVEKLKKELKFDNILIRNDAKCAGLAEKKFGSLKNVNDCVFLCIGTGIGGAGFYNGKMICPNKNSGFEFGHMIIKKGGLICNCGNNGCFESYCSMRKLKKDIAEELKLNEIDSKVILQNLKEKLNKVKNDTTILNINSYNYDYIINKKLNNIIDDYLENLLVGLANITNILEPEAISIGGGFVYYKDILWNKLKNKFETTDLFFNKETRPELKLAEFGNTAGIIGATI